MQHYFEIANAELLDEDFAEARGRKRKKKKKPRKRRLRNFFNKQKEKLKKVGKKLKDKAGKLGKNFRNRFRKILRKQILKNLKRNAHGYSTRLYPAIATDTSKFKKSYVEKAKSNYNQLLKKWLNYGGTESDLKDAITKGASKRRFFKAKSSGIDGYDFYDFMTPDVNIYSNEDGEQTSGEEGVENPETGEEELPTQEESKKGIRAFFAWLRRLFRGNKSDENPYEDGTTESKEFDKDEEEDKKNLPDESEADNDVAKELEGAAKEDDAGGDTDDDAAKKGGDSDDEDGGGKDTILGIPKVPFWIGVSVLGLGAIIGGIYLIRKK